MDLILVFFLYVSLFFLHICPSWVFSLEFVGFYLWINSDCDRHYKFYLSILIDLNLDKTSLIVLKF